MANGVSGKITVSEPNAEKREEVPFAFFTSDFRTARLFNLDFYSARDSIKSQIAHHESVKIPDLCKENMDQIADIMDQKAEFNATNQELYNL